MSDNIQIERTSCGRIVGTSFGIGLDIHGTYTPSEIMRVGSTFEKRFEKTEPHWVECFNECVWLPYDRITHVYCQAVRQRLQMGTVHKCEPDDLHRYLGVSSYTSAWPLYTETSSRMHILSRFFKTMGGVRWLELGCGCGNQLLPLAAHGCDVYGMELNPLMYAERHELLRNKITFGDALLDPAIVYKRGSFDVVVVSMIGFVNHSDLCELFSNLSFLVGKGILVVDLIARDRGTGHIRPIESYKSPLRQAGFIPKDVICDQLVCIKEQLRSEVGA